MFLTDLDSRAAVKGSRDPLGLVPVWGHFGRHVVGNLTTVSGSVRGFTTTLLGYYFAREVQEREAGKGESALALFLKFEQLAGYSRQSVAKDGDFRGVERVKRALDGGGAVRVSADGADQILSNQKVYGLWGLYSGPARASGLLEREETVLTAAAREFVVQEYVSALGKAGFRDGREIVDLLRQPRVEFHVAGKHAALAAAIAGLHRPRFTAREREFYRQYLVEGGPTAATSGLQRQLAELMGELPSGEEFGRRSLRAMVKMAASRGDAGGALGNRLRRIDQLESVLVPADAAFAYAMGRGDGKVADVAGELRKAWGPLASVDADALDSLQGEIGEGFHEAAAGARWLRLGQALATGDYEKVIALLVEQNGFVMQARGGSRPWLSITKGKLDVRFRDAGRDLPEKKVLAGAWVNNYFLNPLRQVVVALGEA